jgi:hypothetical protein
MEIGLQKIVQPRQALCGPESHDGALPAGRSGGAARIRCCTQPDLLRFFRSQVASRRDNRGRVALDRALAIGDRATDGETLAELGAKMGFQAVAVDLRRLWELLGVRRNELGTVLDDHPPLAAIRAAICGPGQVRVKHVESKVRFQFV